MWKLKVLVQFVLAHLPFGENINHRLQRFNRRLRGGQERLTEERLPRLCSSLAALQEVVPLQHAVAVEVGPGWCPQPTFLLYLCGTDTIWTYDHVRHMRFDLTMNMIQLLHKWLDVISGGLGVPRDAVAQRLDQLRGSSNLNELLARANIKYVAPGDATATGLPCQSVDAFYSHDVLEHVPEAGVRRIIREAKRVLRPQGCFYASIGLHDHYAGFDKNVSKVNFLRYPESTWSLFAKNKISYHNRLREHEYLDMLRQCGATLRNVIGTIDPEDVERVKKMKLDSRFKRFTPEQCAVTSTEILATF